MVTTRGQIPDKRQKADGTKPSGKTTLGVVGPRVFQGLTQSMKQTIPTEQGIRKKCIDRKRDEGERRKSEDEG